jgi:hypothetical protein
MATDVAVFATDFLKLTEFTLSMDQSTVQALISPVVDGWPLPTFHKNMDQYILYPRPKRNLYSRPERLVTTSHLTTFASTCCSRLRMRCAANQRSPATDAQASGRYSRIMAPRFLHLTSLSRAIVLPDYTASSIGTGSPLS